MASSVDHGSSDIASGSASSNPDTSWQSNKKLRDFLAQGWALETGVPPERDFSRIKDCSITDLVMEYLHTYGTRSKQLLDEKRRLGNSNPRPPSLTSLVIRKIIYYLKTSTNPNEDMSGLFSPNLPPNALRRLFEDPQVPYVILRKLLNAYQEYTEGAPSLVDIDEMIMKHQRFLRSTTVLPNADQHNLVTLNDLAAFSDTGFADEERDNKFVTFTRQDPPKGGLELLDYRRTPHIKISHCPKRFAESFDKMTLGVLRGIDWSNVIVAGGHLVLQTLLRGSEDAKHEPEFESYGAAIQMHIWGLSPSDALKRIEELYNVWATNISSNSSGPICIKTCDYVYFITDTPRQSVKVRLKLFSSPLHVLLHHRPDICAIGFDGVQVSMLPGCARALETGYHSFSTTCLYDDASTGHGLDRGRSLNVRTMSQYARMGFGIRILPSYARSLCEEIDLSRLDKDDSPDSIRRTGHKGEPGVKVLKRLAFSGQNWTDLISPGEPSESLNDNAESDESETFQFQAGLVEAPFGCFEAFVRQSFEAARYSYEIGDGIQIDDILGIQRFNDEVFATLKAFICTRVNVPYQFDGWRDYVTRRIRWRYRGPDLASILEKQLVVPVCLPYDLEQQIKQIVDDVREEYEGDIPDFLVPIHQLGKGRGLIPDYIETTDSGVGNLKYWVRSNEMMWRGIDPRIDEVFNVLEMLFHIFMDYDNGWNGRDKPTKSRIDTEYFKNRLGARLCQRLPPDLDDCYPTPGEDVNLVFGSGAGESLYPHTSITAKEALKFGFWVFGGPGVQVSREAGEAPIYPFPDEAFWKEGDEGQPEGGEVPQWTERIEGMDLD